MRLRGKLAGAFISLMAAAILITIGYSILFIRDHMYQQKEGELLRFAQQAHAARNSPQAICQLAVQHGYLALTADANGQALCGDSQLATLLPQLQSQLHTNPQPTHPDYLLTHVRRRDGLQLWVALPRETVLNQLRPIRWIIYHAMFITLGLVALAALALSLALSRPIVRIKKTLEEIAQGKPELLERDSRRKDEIGMIARALNSVSANLRRDNARLREANAQQARFYSDIAHELNNPLHAMQGALEMLRLKGDDAPARTRYLEILQNQTDRMSSLFKDVLTLQQADYAPEYLHPQAVALRPLAERAAQPYLDAMREKGLAWQLDVPECRVMADPKKLEQVLDNLLSNALKYTQAGSVTLSAQRHNSPAPPQVEIRVTDTGPGIAAEHLPRLTDRFYRTDSARARAAGGTGLGLAVVKSLLEAHGSQLHIDSVVGQGTTFAFALPLAAADTGG